MERPVEILLDGRPVLLLCSNNYLGLADHPRVREAAAEAAMRYGAGSGASRLISGNMTPHRRLEQKQPAQGPRVGSTGAVSNRDHRRHLSGRGGPISQSF